MTLGITAPLGLLLSAPLLAHTPSETTLVEDTTEDLEWSDGHFYLTTGASPGSTFHLDGFNPLIRYDAELGMRWSKDKTSVSIGANPWILQRLEAPKAGGGLHGVVTVGYEPFYVRGGIGVLAGVPGSVDDRDVRSSLSALAGFGLESRGEHVRGRIGIDYLANYDKSGRVNNSVFLVLGLRFG
jgi:hypothetical protein